MNIRRRQRLASDTPIALSNFLNTHPCHAAQGFALNRYHRVGDVLDHSGLGFAIENTLTHLNIDHWA